MTANKASNEVSYPDGYTPMTDDELFRIYMLGDESKPYEAEDNPGGCRAIERAVLARLPKPDAEPVAWAMPNSAITDSNRFMMVRLEVPSDDEYGGAFWIPLYAHPPKPDAEPVARVNSEGFIVEIGDIPLAEGMLLYANPTKPEISKTLDNYTAEECDFTDTDNLIKMAHRYANAPVLTHLHCVTYALAQKLEEALDVTKSAEPVAWLDLGKLNVGGMAYATSLKATSRQTLLYTHPPKPDTAEREALVRRIDEWILADEINEFNVAVLIDDIRVHLVGGGE